MIKDKHEDSYENPDGGRTEASHNSSMWTFHGGVLYIYVFFVRFPKMMFSGI